MSFYCQALKPERAHLAVGLDRPDQYGVQIPAGTPASGVWGNAFDANTDADMRRPDQGIRGAAPAGSTAPGGDQGHDTPTRDLIGQTEVDVRRPGQLVREESMAGSTSFGGHPEGSSEANTTHDEVWELISQGVGRRRLAAQLDISEHSARRLLGARRNGDGR